MLFVVHGTNIHKVANQTTRLVEQLLKKKPDAQVFYFEGGNVKENDLDQLIEAQGLFVEKHIVVLKQTLEIADSRDIVFPRLKRFATTQNVFIVSENKLIAEHKKELAKHAEKIEEHKKEVKQKNDFNVFKLGDALGTKNKKALWIGYREALRNGQEPESIHGTLHWAVRGMIASRNASSPEEAGQKQYTYDKFKRYSKAFGEGELEKLSRELITIYHNVRRGEYELKPALERWVLRL
jgi:DNA polymerase III delta subunit